ncbi:MAG: hypothetical protein RIM80_10940, partial [Alphaproteobacteria bacterium]
DAVRIGGREDLLLGRERVVELHLQGPETGKRVGEVSRPGDIAFGRDFGSCAPLPFRAVLVIY